MQKSCRKWIEFRVEPDRGCCDLDGVLQQLADVFHQYDLGGVVIDDPHEQPQEEWGPDSRRVLQPAVSAYLPQGREPNRCCRLLRRRFEELQTALGVKLQTALREVDEEDWAESWKRFFKPIRVCDHILVKPSWESVDAAAGDLVIDIDPGMAFGTGDHPTTRLCIELIRQYLAPGAAVLDVGTGSGILSIVAAGLGAREVWAVDRDEVALATAKENLRRNGIDETRYRIVCGHLLQSITGRFDLVVANILSEVILELAADLPRVLPPGGMFIASGINSVNAQRVAAGLKSSGFTLQRQLRREDWVALAGRWKNRAVRASAENPIF